MTDQQQQAAGRRRWRAAALVAVLVAGAAWYGWRLSGEDALPAGIVTSNGRTEAQRVDIATKFAGRLAGIVIDEGDRVTAGQAVARLVTDQIDAQIREADAGVRQAQAALAQAEAALAEAEAQRVYAEQELSRATQLLGRGFATAETADLRRAEERAAAAAVAAAQAGIGSADAAVASAKATADRLRADVAEYVLYAPTDGRVQYRLAEPGEVLSAGETVVTMLDLSRVHMTVYLPTDAAGGLSYGDEARLIFDAAPQYVVPAFVSFVAAEAQFTPKYVETASEREKLTFRVQLDIPADVLRAHEAVVKTGVPGVAYVRVDQTVSWPEALQVRLPAAQP